jgi:hypothetical protein
LKSAIRKAPQETTRTITITREPETIPAGRTKSPMRSIPIYTETMGDLYFKQGYPRLAAEVFRTLNETNETPRLAEKLVLATESIKDKES